MKAARSYSDLIEIHLSKGVRSVRQNASGVVVEFDDGSSALGLL